MREYINHSVIIEQRQVSIASLENQCGENTFRYVENRVLKFGGIAQQGLEQRFRGASAQNCGQLCNNELCAVLFSVLISH